MGRGAWQSLLQETGVCKTHPLLQDLSRNHIYLGQPGAGQGPQLQIRQKPPLTPHLHTKSRTLPALLSDCDGFVFEISVGLFE